MPFRRCGRVVTSEWLYSDETICRIGPLSSINDEVGEIVLVPRSSDVGTVVQDCSHPACLAGASADVRASLPCKI